MRIAVTFLGAMCLTSAALAQSTPDPEERLDGALRMSGYVSGLAHQCSASDKKTEVELEVMDRTAQITRLLGSDRAFYYAAAFGAGSTAVLDRKTCVDHLRAFEAERKSGWATTKR